MTIPTLPMSLLPPSPNSTSPGSSTCSTPRAVSLNSAALQPTPPAYSKGEETISSQDRHRGRRSSDPVQFTDHPTVRVTSTDVKEMSSSLPSSNDFNDRMISTFRNRSRSPATGSSVIRDEGELRLQTSDHPLSSSWWGEEKHVIRSSKKTEQTEALQSTRKVSNNLILDSELNAYFCVVQMLINLNVAGIQYFSRITSVTLLTAPVFRKSHKLSDLRWELLQM